MLIPTALCLALAPLQERTEAPEHEQVVARLRTIVEERLADGGLERAAVAIEFRGRRLPTMRFGDPRARVEPDAPLPAAPLGRLMLAGTALVVLSGSDTTLDTGLGELLPELGELAEGRTVRHLLARTSGLPQVPAPAEGADLSPAAALATIAELAPQSDPNECVRFSSADDLALGLLIERVSGKSLEEAVSASLLRPFGLEQAWGAARDDDKLRPPSMVAANIDLGVSEREETEMLDLWGFRSLRLSPEQALELWSAYTGGALGNATLAEAAFTPQRVTSHNGGSHGFRVHRTQLGDLVGWLHGGGFGEQHVSLVEYPEAELRIAILGEGYEPELPTLARYAARAVLDWPEPEPIDLPLARERRSAFVGDYKIGCNLLAIVVRDDRLFLERSDVILPLAYRGGNVFTDVEDPDLRLEFELGRDGHALRFLLDDHGQVAIATRLE